MLTDNGVEWCKNTHEEFMESVKYSICARAWCYANHDKDKLMEMYELLRWGIYEIMENKTGKKC